MFLRDASEAASKSASVFARLFSFSDSAIVEMGAGRPFEIGRIMGARRNEFRKARRPIPTNREWIAVGVQRAGNRRRTFVSPRTIRGPERHAVLFEWTECA